MLSEVDFADIGGKSYHRHDNVCLFGHGSGRIGPGRSLGKHQRGFASIPCIDRDPIMRLLQVVAHGRPHDAGADPAHARLGRGDNAGRESRRGYGMIYSISGVMRFAMACTTPS